MKNYIEDKNVQKNRWWILTAIGMFTIMSTLDGSIVNIALPVMSRDLHIPMNQAEWVVSIYLMMICGLLLFFGRLGDSIGKIKVFRVGMVLFLIGSLFAGFNNSLALLLAARIVQATGASMTMANNNGIVTEIFPMNERGRALGLIGSFVSIGAIAGPGIGGLILGQLPWGYIFWINIPIGIVALILGTIVLPKDLPSRRVPIDWAGFVTFLVLILSLFMGIFLGQERGFTDPLILGLFALAIVAFAAFVHIENHKTDPLVSFKIFQNSAFTLSLLSAFFIFVTNFFFNVISPFYLQNARGLSPEKAGYLLMIFPIVQVIVAPVAGSIANRIGPYRITMVGLLIIVASQIGYAFFNLQTSFMFVALMIGLVGFGNGLFQAPNNTVVMSSVPTRDLGIAGGMNALARNLGMVVGISTATTVLFSSMSHTAGKKVTTYLTGQPDIFISGMHVSFWVATGLCILAVALTGYPMWQVRHETAV